ncbi:Ig-like domain-containing protein [Bacillus benzoevorans]|uniref:SbsA Ig-like domain-containing protein n=1 Tax=Bacillus benzoevorans TaxID=1456 RepID=A0A7X0LV21_9BACI|nr:Ig-like domain-containing protein [Bacillus benzoevorans]MBB6445153.1 hypothetical protein [Bacillus benzoevorans]
MNFVVFKRKSGKLFSSLLLLAAILAVYLPANSAKAEVLYATEDVENLKIDSPIVLVFDQAIQFNPMFITNPATPNTNFNGIQLLDLTNPLIPTPVSIHLEAAGNKLKVIPDPSLLSPDTDYQLVIDKDIVTTGAPGGFVFANAALIQTLTYEFSTGSLSFLELMRGGGEINDLIEYFTPRQMIVTAPVRYFDKMEAIHRQRGMSGTDTESVTNLNISLDDPYGKVVRIVVKVGVQEKEINYLHISGASPSYDFAFAGLPDRGYDIQVFAYNSVDEEDDEHLLDSRVIKVAPTPNKATTTVKANDSYKMAGRSFTLYQLMQKEKDMQKLLTENSMKDIKVQVVEEN